MTQHEGESLVAGFALRGIDSTRLLLRFGISIDLFVDNELRAVISAAFTLATHGSETTALSVLLHIKEQTPDTDLACFAGASRKEKLEAVDRLLQRLGEEFPRLSIQTTPEGMIAFLKSEALRRRLAGVARELYTKITGGANISEAVAATLAELLSINSTIFDIHGIISLAQAVRSAHKEAADEASGQIVSLSTGYKQLDTMIHGLRGSRLYVVAAEEKAGKSLLCSALAFGVARAGDPVGIISMEMSGKDIAARLCGCKETEPADARALKLAQFSDAVDQCPLYIRSGGVTAAKMTALAYELVLKYRARLLIIDYLQIATFDGHATRVNEVDTLVSGLKSFAMSFDIPVILISSINNKQLSGRTLKKPTAADLRDSGRIANDCDVLMFLWNPEPDVAPTYRELFISRGRNGEAGTMGLVFNADTLRFEESPKRSFIPPPDQELERPWQQ